MTTTPSTTAPAGPTGRQRVALALLLTAGFTLAVDFSILGVALPVIGAELGIPLGQLPWVTTAFALPAAGFTLLLGRVADLHGRRRVFLGGTALLGVASLAGGLATDPALLLAARAGQGLATAAMTPAALSLLTTSFPEGPLRDRVLGLNGALMAAGFTSGAVLGGVLADLVSWRWAFLLNVPVALAVLVLGPAVLDAGSAPERRRLDLPGAVVVTLGLLALVGGLTRAGEASFADPVALGLLAAAAALLAAFGRIEVRAADPLVPLPVLRRRGTAVGTVAVLLAFATETALVFLLTLHLQEVLGWSALAVGLAFAVLGTGTVLGGVLAPRVLAAAGVRAGVAGALVVQAAATLPLAFLSPQPGWTAVLLVATFVGGVANLVAIVGSVVATTAGVPDAEQGAVTGLAALGQQVGITLGIPVMSAVVVAVTGGAGGPDALPGGLAAAIAVDGGLCLAAAALVAVGLRARRAG